MTAVEEFYLLEVERARDRAKPAHGYDRHCLCYGCTDTRADLERAARGQPQGMCPCAGTPAPYGGVYPCGHFLSDEWE